jgi:hypothetical protein
VVPDGQREGTSDCARNLSGGGRKATRTSSTGTPGDCRKTLLAHNDYLAAPDWIEKYVELNPTSSEMQAALAKAKAEIKFSKLIQISDSSASIEAENLPDPEVIARKCVEATSDIRSYRSQMIIRDRRNKQLKSNDYIATEWRFEFELSDKYHVRQIVFEEELNQSLLDEWISIGGETYHNVGFWVSGLSGEDPRNERSYLLSIDKYVSMLRWGEDIAAAQYRFGTSSYYLLNITANLHEFPECCRGKLWIDCSTNLIAKAEMLTAQAPADNRERLEQVFTSYGERIEITPPQEVSNVK